MKKLIYLIEDDFGVIDVYKTGLEIIGKFKVEVFETCQKIKEKIEELGRDAKGIPDLILLDLIMPECNGIQILQDLKSKEATKNIPVFILTNYGSKELQKMGFDLKTEQYLIKTETTPTLLVEIVKKRLK
jgi:two-component system, OmpR family, alkaline phosphatase synthesis response regulator PhoP